MKELTMTLLKTVLPEEASGKVKDGYDFFQSMANMVPLPIQMVSPSPELLTIMIDTVKYYTEKSGLSFSLLAHIRLLVSQNEDFPYCLDLNRGILEQIGGLSPEALDAVLSDVNRASLEPSEVELLKFAVKTVEDPASTSPDDIETLHSLGWTDTNIFDAVNEGLLMLTRGMMFKAFRMSE